LAVKGQSLLSKTLRIILSTWSTFKQARTLRTALPESATIVFMDVIVGGDIINNEDSAVRNQTVIVLHTVWILIDLCAGWHPVILVTIISLGQANEDEEED